MDIATPALPGEVPPPLGFADQVDRLLHCSPAGLGRRDAVNPGGKLSDLHLEYVLAKLEHDRTGCAAKRLFSVNFKSVRRRPSGTATVGAPSDDWTI